MSHPQLEIRGRCAWLALETSARLEEDLAAVAADDGVGAVILRIAGCQPGSAAAVAVLEEMPKPTIAAVGGRCAGPRLALTRACDLVVCDEAASFAAPAPRGGSIDAEQARSLGLVDLVVPAGLQLEEAGAIAARLAARAPLTQVLIKGAVARVAPKGLADAIELGELLRRGERQLSGCRRGSVSGERLSTPRSAAAFRAPPPCGRRHAPPRGP